MVESEAQLVSSGVPMTADRDNDKLVKLLIKERPTVLAYIRSIVLNHHLAEDVFQEVAVVVLRKRESIDLSGDLLRWVLGVARLESLTALRKRGATPLCYDGQFLDALDASWEEHIKENGTDQVEAREALGYCLQKLTDRARLILELRYKQGLSGEKLAARLDSKLNTAYVALSRIHKQLRTCVDAFKSRSH